MSESASQVSVRRDGILQDSIISSLKGALWPLEALEILFLVFRIILVGISLPIQANDCIRVRRRRKRAYWLC